MTNPRRLAWTVLQRVNTGDAYSHIALSAALDAETETSLPGRDRGLTTELVYGVLTWQRAIDQLLDDALHRGVRSVDAAVLDVLRIATYQLHFLDRIPPHAAIDEAVEHVRVLDGNTGLANAVLRAISRIEEPVWWRPGDRERKVARYLGARWSLPNWLANRLQQQFGLERAESLAEAFNARPPIWVRRTALSGLDAAERHDRLDDEVRAMQASGEAVIQDLGSIVVTLYAQAAATERVLDACAGLGGKSLHLAGLGADVVALDPLSSKLELLRETATTLGVEADIETVEGELQSLPAEELFDGVLVDAPCTGLGVLRRHPETRWRRSEADIQTLAKIQAELLDTAANHVRPGGWLTYSVCTWTREETSRQAERFLERHPDFRATTAPAELARYLDDDGWLHVMPDQHDGDSFFAARFLRTTS